MKITTLILALFLPLAASAQFTIPQRTGALAAAISIGTITLDGSAHCTAAGNGTSVSCTLTGVTAGDLITVEHEDDTSGVGNASLVSDPSNGPYTTVYYSNDPTDPNNAGISYVANSAAGNLVVKVTFAEFVTYGNISAQAWKGASASGVLDTGAVTKFLASTSGTVANANCGTAVSPSGNGELILGYAASDNTTATAGSGFTVIGAQTASNPATPEFEIQTTATATNAPFVNGADDWLSGCAAFLPSGRSSSLIPLEGMYADLTGNTNGTALSAANLEAGTSNSLLGGWGGTFSGATYNTTITPPNRVSPVWINGGTHAGNTGIAIDHVSDASESFNWTGSAPAVSAPESLSFFFRTAYTRNTNSDLCDMAQVAHGGSGDNVTLQTGFTPVSGLGLRLEISNGTTVTSPFVTINPNQWYWVSMQLSLSGNHQLAVFSQATPGSGPWTLLGTSTSPVETSGTGNVIFQIGNQGSCDNSGSHVFYAYPEADAFGLAGFPVLP